MATVATYTANTATVASGSSATASLPTGVTVGDYLLLAVDIGNGYNGGIVSSSCTTPSGFTYLNDITSSGYYGSTETMTHTYFFYRIADGTESSTYSSTVTSLENGSPYTAGVNCIMAHIGNWDPAGGSTNFIFTSYQNNASSANGVTTSTLPMVNQNDLIICFASAVGNPGVTVASSAGSFTSIVTQAGTISGLSLFTYTYPTGTTFPATTVTPLTAEWPQLNNVFVIALQNLVQRPASVLITVNPGVSLFRKIISAVSVAVHALISIPNSSGQLSSKIFNKAKSAIPNIINRIKS
jgi:hypothetical protein